MPTSKHTAEHCSGLFMVICYVKNVKNVLQIHKISMSTVYDLCIFIIFHFVVLTSSASTPEEMREENKKEQEGEKSTSSEEGKAAKVKASKPLMPTSTILRLLAELVRSYVGIATLIASYCYTAGQSELIKEVGS